MRDYSDELDRWVLATRVILDDPGDELPKGITDHKGRFQASVYKDKKAHYVGKFATVGEAVAAREEWIARGGEKPPRSLPPGIQARRRNSFQARIRANGGDVYVGSFPTIEEAVAARERMMAEFRLAEK